MIRFWKFSLGLLAVVLAAQDPAAPWIKTRQRLTILSANDGQSHLRLNADMKLDREYVTKDSITVIHLGPDHPPIVKTVYGTVPNTISGSPYMAMTGDGHYGFVTSNGEGTSKGEPENLMSVIDLTSPTLAVVQKITVPHPTMVDMHPDGRHVVVPCATGFQVFEMRGSQLVLVKDNRTAVIPSSIDVSPQGDRIIATGRISGVHVFSYKDGVIEYLSEVKFAFDAPFSPRFGPDGRRVLVPNGGGSGTKGTLDDVLSIDMTLFPPAVTEVIPQVADGMESLAFHPDGHMAVVACLEEFRIRAHTTYSHLAVIDLTSKPARLLYHVNVEAIPEGIEFSPDGSQLFVGLTSANHIAVFDVDRFLIQRSPFVIRVGHGPSSMALGPRFMH
jgi:DNA-binding beta-propeller fold protein YncE